MATSFFLRASIVVLVVLLSFLSACGVLTPPEECPFTGTADPAVFQQYLDQVVLVRQGARVVPDALPATENLTFSTQDNLELVLLCKTDAQGSICIGEARGGGKIVFNQDWAFSASAGSGTDLKTKTIPLGVFKVGPYVIRIAAADTLVKNISFTVK